MSSTFHPIVKRTFVVLLFLFCGGKTYSQCNPPAVINISNITHNSADIAWPAVLNAIGYEVAFATTPSPSTGTISTNTSVNLIGLQPDTKYYICIRTVCSSGNSSWNCTSFYTLAFCNKPVITLKALAGEKGLVSWPAVAGAVKYEYYWAVYPNTLSSGIQTTATSALANGLVKGTLYNFCVRTVCDMGFSPAVSDWTCDTLRAIDCIPPANIQFSSVSETDITAAWDTLMAVTGYEYEFSKSPSVAPASGQITTTGSAQQTGLQSNTKYDFWIRTICGLQKSSWAQDTISTKPATGINTYSMPGLVRVYPNPVKTILNIDVPAGAKDAKLIITNLHGAIIYQADADNKTQTLDISLFAPGLYFLKYSDKDHSQTVKFTRE